MVGHLDPGGLIGLRCLYSWTALEVGQCGQHYNTHAITTSTCERSEIVKDNAQFPALSSSAVLQTDVSSSSNTEAVAAGSINIIQHEYDH
jgi:hypothetical protein